MTRVVIELLRLARWLLPTRRVVLVHGFPSIEANAVELVRVLLDKTSARVTWLDAPGEDFRARQRLNDSDRLTIRSRVSLAGLWDYLTAELVCFTHGFYGAPGSVGRKPIINLWHGNGPKAPDRQSLFPRRQASGDPYDVVLVSAGLFSREFREKDGDSKEVWDVGYPRNVVFGRRDQAAGQDFRHSVLWAPAFRSARVRRTEWTDVIRSAPGADGAGTPEVKDLAPIYAEVLARHGVTLLMRPHPSDAESFAAIDNCELVTDEWLEARGLHLYDVLQGVGGLLSDVSSIWVDFLLSGRPIGFVFPDIDDYRRGRGISPADVFDHQPELFIESAEDMAHFAREVVAPRAERFDPALLAATCRTIDPQGGDLLVEALDRAGMLSGTGR